MQGKKVCGYTLLRPLGQGGMAEVWYAENKIHKPAAVKFLLPKFCSDSDVVRRFKTEAEVTVKLSHPNIRQVYDYDEVDGRPCMVMEYLEGEDLSSRMKHGERFSDEQLRTWWDQLADALNYTHEQGVVHRDIKPSNIFVDARGNVKLLDFGIAKVRDSIVSTHTGATMGTLMYMSPEQVRDSKNIDKKTDLYSLAVTFVHLLSGSAPYDMGSTDDYEIRKNIVETSLDLIGVPSVWQTFLRPYLAKNPADRPVLREFSAETSPSGYVPPVSPVPVSEEMVGGAAAATRVLADDDTVAETPSTQPQPQPQPKPQSQSQSQSQPRSRKVWPWVLAALAAVVVAIILLVRGCDGGVKTDNKGETKPAAEMTEEGNKEEQTSSDESTSGVTYQNGSIVVNGKACYKMVYVSGGTFTMGCTGEQGSDCYRDETPAHEVTVSGFYMGETEVTQALWKAVMGANPSDFKGDNLSVENVSWDDCQKFIKKLNELTGKTFRLPTEAEWEYAARGGNKSRGCKYSGSDDIDDVAWYDDNSGSKTHAVKQKRANELGLYDMSGNVWEWCNDRYGDYSSTAQTNPKGASSGSFRVSRGGSWHDSARNCRVSDRDLSYPSYRYDYLGLRLVLVP